MEVRRMTTEDKKGVGKGEIVQISERQSLRAACVVN